MATQTKNSKNVNLKRSKQTNNKWLPCVCKICNEHMDLITHPHAHRHGYKTKEEMIADGKLEFKGYYHAHRS